MSLDLERYTVARLNNSRKARWVFRLAESESGRAIVLKVYENRKEARPEREVLCECGGDPRFVRLLAYRECDGAGVIAMAYVDGINMHQLLQSGKPLEPRTVADIAIEILTGLKTLHESGFVHGDLKAKNILITRWEPPIIKLIDFQHAVKKRRGGRAKALRTIPNPPAKFAPECRTGVIDDRYDLYAVGHLGASLLMGTDIDERPADVDPIEPSDADARNAIRRLWNIFVTATESDPEDRYGSAGEMIRALRSLQGP